MLKHRIVLPAKLRPTVIGRRRDRLPQQASIGRILLLTAGIVLSPATLAVNEADDAITSDPPLQITDEAAPPLPTHGPFELLDSTVPPGEIRRLAWRTGFGYGLTDDPTPVLVAHGKKPGEVICLTAAIHGDELNGIEVVRRVMGSLDPAQMSGTIIGVPIVNVHGFQRRSRYLPDRRDLNRYFPGDPQGSLASRVAHSFFTRIVRACTVLVDLHTGSFQRTNLPQLRADLRNPQVAELSRQFGALTVLHSAAAGGTLRGAASAADIPAVTFEIGEPNRLEATLVAPAVAGIRTLLAVRGLVGEARSDRAAPPVFYDSRWVRVDRGGILFSKVDVGQSVRAGDVLGTVTDPLSNVYAEVTAPFAGRVLGMALNQFVMPGFAAFRLGVETDEEKVVETPEPVDEDADQDQPPS